MSSWADRIMQEVVDTAPDRDAVRELGEALILWAGSEDDDE